ncbi:ABC transporter transmembrane region [Paracoccus seriniphilus]|uniref:ABC transporter transmembrane region n=1 Tax=Paracoccus seriniphilus TaxID=184748 RepID=A0A239Q1W1_9RHOB|nr:ABC transporter transmembrane region [Paracoccus seriniphilus]
MGGAAGVQLVLSAAGVFLGASIAYRIGQSLRADMFGKVHSLALSQVQSFTVGSLNTRCTNDVLQVQSMLIMAHRGCGPGLDTAFRPVTMPHNPLTAVRQNLSGMLRNEGVSLGPQRSRQHPARPVTGDLGQRVINRFRLTQRPPSTSLSRPTA